MPPLQLDDILEPIQEITVIDKDFLFWIPEPLGQSMLYFLLLSWFLVIIYYRIFPHKHQPPPKRRGILRNIYIEQR